MRKNRIFILGAGFSRAAGVPLAAELWREVRRRALALTGRAADFHEDLEDYIKYKKNCDYITLSQDSVDFEEFLAFLDIEHYLGLRGSDTWSIHGNETQVIVKFLIGQILAEATPQVETVPELYRRFAAALQPSDYVLTFNYDVLLERALDSVKKPYRLFPQRLKNISRYQAEVDNTREEVVLLKLHGSIDWFDRTQHSQLAAEWAEQGLRSQPRDPIFSRPSDFDLVPLVDEPRFPSDPLTEMYRVRRRLDLVYKPSSLFRCTPCLLNPSSLKLLYALTFRDFWHGLESAGIWNLGLAIIGFSLPPQDDYVRQVLYRLVCNYQTEDEDISASGLKKAPVIIVDYKESEQEIEEFKKRYAFVDWTKTTFYKDGLDGSALDLLLNN